MGGGLRTGDHDQANVCRRRPLHGDGSRPLWSVYRHRSVDFGAFKEAGEEASLEATLVDNDNVVWTALYSFRRVPNGDWLISGCVLAKAEGSAI
jgi:hypothetical protein